MKIQLPNISTPTSAVQFSSFFSNQSNFRTPIDFRWRCWIPSAPDQDGNCTFWSPFEKH